MKDDKGETYPFTPVAQVVMDRREEFEYKFITNNVWKSDNEDTAFAGIGNVYSHINETIIKVLEAQVKDLEGRKIIIPKYASELDYPFWQLHQETGVNACLQFQIDLINETIEQIK